VPLRLRERWVALRRAATRRGELRDIEVPVAFVPQAEHGLPGRLGFAPAPGRWTWREEGSAGDAIEQDLASLRRACGASVLVTLLEEAEMSRIGLADLLDRARRSGLECHWLPIPDGAAPSDLEATSRLVARVIERLATGRTVIVHCHGGIGRSGTIAACALVGVGVEPGRAVDVVRQARAGAATAPGQEEFVHEFGRALKRSAGTAGTVAQSPHER
jgi:cyclin-dependent kinase inhibitor 3